MLHWVFIIATWLIGIFGVTGAIVAIVAFLYLGPAVVIPIVTSAFERFIKCIWCVVAVVFVLATVGSYWVGHHEAEVQCRANDLAAELRNAQIDRDNAVKAKTDESNRANQIETDANEQHSKDIIAIADLKRRPVTCAFDDIDSGTSSVPNDKSGASNAQPAPGADKAGPRVASPVPHKRLLLPMVRDSWLPWRGRKSDAAPDK